MTDKLDLMVVMPVYNEVDGLVDCLDSWVATLGGVGASYELIVLDDGSTDGSGELLANLEANRPLRVVRKGNEGHGPTIFRGYREAVTRAEWVFQTDSDNEIPASAFPSLWQERDDVDAVLGRRIGREQSFGRRVLSAMARRTVSLAFGSRVADVNVPFRLMRSSVLAPILAEIPADTFAPNVVITGALSRTGAAVREVEVPHTVRAAGSGSIAGLKTLRVAARSFWQSVRLARRFG